MSDTRTPLPHALCQRLCSKKLMMFLEARDVAVEDLQTAGYENFWCRHTDTDTGPDGGWVTYDRCAPGRACYEPLDRNTGIGYRIRQQQT